MKIEHRLIILALVAWLAFLQWQIIDTQRQLLSFAQTQADYDKTVNKNINATTELLRAVVAKTDGEKLP